MRLLAQTEALKLGANENQAPWLSSSRTHTDRPHVEREYMKEGETKGIRHLFSVHLKIVLN